MPANSENRPLKMLRSRGKLGSMDSLACALARMPHRFRNSDLRRSVSSKLSGLASGHSPRAPARSSSMDLYGRSQSEQRPPSFSHSRSGDARRRRRSSLKRWILLHLNVTPTRPDTRDQLFPLDRHLSRLFHGDILSQQPGSIDFSVSRKLGRGAYGFCCEVAVWGLPDKDDQFHCKCDCHSRGQLRKFTVYKAIKIMTSNVVAKKRELIEREVAVHARLRHENILRLYGGFVEQSSGSVCLLLDLCALGSLSDRIAGPAPHNAKPAPLDEPAAVKVFYGLVRALHYLHTEHRIVHRDLKPANVMLYANFIPKLSDFGLSCTIQHSLEMKHVICGTPNYLAPEVLLKMGHSFASDFWSLGCTLYYCLCGHSPFQAKGAADAAQLEDSTWREFSGVLLGTERQAALAGRSMDHLLRNIYRRVLTGRYHFPPHVSQAARRAIRGLLRREQTDRCSAQELFQMKLAHLTCMDSTASYCCQCAQSEANDCTTLSASTPTDEATPRLQRRAWSPDTVSISESTIASLVHTGEQAVVVSTLLELHLLISLKQDAVSILADRFVQLSNGRMLRGVHWISRWALTSNLILYFTLDVYNSKLSLDESPNLTPTLRRSNHKVPLAAGDCRETWGAIDSAAQTVVLTPGDNVIERMETAAESSVESGSGLSISGMKKHCEFLEHKLRRFQPDKDVMAEFLRTGEHSVNNESEEAGVSPAPLIVNKWILAEDEIVFLFTDGSYQLNFKSHRKLLVFGHSALYIFQRKIAQGKKDRPRTFTQIIPDVHKWLKYQDAELKTTTWRLLRPLI